MLANYRCNEIKDQILHEFDPELKEFMVSSAKQNMNNFKEEAQNIINGITQKYDQVACNYQEKIYLNVKKQMLSALSQKFYVCFENQAKRIVPISQKFMRQDLQKEVKNSNTSFKFR